jgi:sec-independent protein translocase protein TatC
MARKLKPIGFDDRLSVVDHLDELRSRLFICIAALAIAFGFCFWQNTTFLNILNHALPLQPKTTPNHLSGLTSDTVSAAHAMARVSGDFGSLSGAEGLSPAERREFRKLARDSHAVAAALPQTEPKRLPVTLGIGEPFTTTLTVSAYFALLFALPLILYEIYAFVLPALNPTERRVALPVMLAAPLLFILGVVFAFFLVLPPAVRFLQSFNSENFDILLQARPYYTFELMTMLGIGLAFQLPIALLALQRLGVINGDTLIHQWRYAVVIIAVIAAALPGPDPVTTAMETLPLLLLYGVSIVLLKIADRRSARRALHQADDLLDAT